MIMLIQINYATKHKMVKWKQINNCNVFPTWFVMIEMWLITEEPPQTTWNAQSDIGYDIMFTRTK